MHCEHKVHNGQLHVTNRQWHHKLFKMFLSSLPASISSRWRHLSHCHTSLMSRPCWSQSSAVTSVGVQCCLASPFRPLSPTAQPWWSPSRSITSISSAQGRLVKLASKWADAAKVRAMDAITKTRSCGWGNLARLHWIFSSWLGPKVSLSSSVVDFGFVREGGVVEQTVEIVNNSPAEAVYQMDLDVGRHSVFSIQPASGAIRPNGKVSLRASYRPTHPIIHHRRVACLILHRVGGTHTPQMSLADCSVPSLPTILCCRSPSSWTWSAPVTQSSSSQQSWSRSTCSSVTNGPTHNCLPVACRRVVARAWSNRPCSVFWRR